MRSTLSCRKWKKEVIGELDNSLQEGATQGILTLSPALAGNTVVPTQMISGMHNFSSSTDQ